MTILEKLKILMQEARSDDNRTHHDIAREAISEIERLNEQEKKLKTYEKIYGKL